MNLLCVILTLFQVDYNTTKTELEYIISITTIFSELFNIQMTPN